MCLECFLAKQHTVSNWKNAFSSFVIHQVVQKHYSGNSGKLKNSFWLPNFSVMLVPKIMKIRSCLLVLEPNMLGMFFETQCITVNVCMYIYIYIHLYLFISELMNNEMIMNLLCILTGKHLSVNSYQTPWSKGRSQKSRRIFHENGHIFKNSPWSCDFLPMNWVCPTHVW